MQYTRQLTNAYKTSKNHTATKKAFRPSRKLTSSLAITRPRFLLARDCSGDAPTSSGSFSSSLASSSTTARVLGVMGDWEGRGRPTDWAESEEDVEGVAGSACVAERDREPGPLSAAGSGEKERSRSRAGGGAGGLASRPL